MIKAVVFVLINVQDFEHLTFVFKGARNYWTCILENFKKVRTYKGFSRQECKGAMIFCVTRTYATFRAKVIKITYRSMVGQFLGEITR